MEQVRLAKKKVYGTSSEQTKEELVGQLSFMFDETEAWLSTRRTATRETRAAAHTRQKRSSRVEEVLPENIPVEVVEHRVPESERNCPECGTLMTEIGTEVRRTLVMVPAQVKIREDVYFTYACQNCKQTGTETPILKAPKEPPLISGSYASPEAVAHIMVQKFVMYAPLYRQEQEWNRAGVMLSRQTMSNWVLRVAEDGCGAGVCVTASHNPAKYNGYKVYGADGCQITLEVAAKILAAIEAVDCFAVQPADFDAALAEGKIEYSSEKCLDDFVDAVYAQRVGDGAGTADLKLVYTPLNGSGLECVKKLLAKLGVTHVTVVPEQEKPDGNFPTCPYPNPEIREAMQKGLELCDKVHPDLLLGTDPDCDRCGTAVPDGKGGYRLITGNEMGIILLDYICRTRKALGTMPEHPVAVTTIVSTDMATPVAAKYGVELRRTLTGFKFIGEQIGLLEAAGEADRYIFGFEESYGYLSGAHVRDKDAVNATLLVCEAAAWYAKQGMTLLDAINKLYAEFGCYRNALHSFAFEGESGMHTMDAIMKQLRQTPPTAIGGMAVESMVDYNTAGTGLPKANVLEFRLAGGAKLMVRPSGTEPKIKVYLSAVAPTEEAADAINDTLGKAASALLKA